MIPPDKECDYCEKHYNHGGKCDLYRKSYKAPCLGFKQDPRGRIVFHGEKIDYEFKEDKTIKHRKIPAMVFPMSHDFPKLGEWDNKNYTVGGKDTPIKFTKIIPFKWIVGRTLGVECWIEYYCYDNSDYDEQGEKKLAEVIPIRKGR